MLNKLISLFISFIISFCNFFGIDAPVAEVFEFRDIAYGEHERNTYNLYLPTGKETNGLVLLIHGGAWLGGDKGEFDSRLNEVSKEMGFACAAVNYRFINDSIDLIDITDDIQLAVSHIKALALENGVNLDKMLLSGGSAGGHLSMLYAYSRDEVSAIKPAAVVSYCGPTDLSDDAYYFDNGLGDGEYVAQVLSWASGYKHTFATRSEAKDALWNVSPLKYVDKNTVPTVINHGMVDDIVPFSNAKALDEKMTEYGIGHIFNAYPNSGHGLNNDRFNETLAESLFKMYIIKYLT